MPAQILPTIDVAGDQLRQQQMMMQTQLQEQELQFRQAQFAAEQQLMPFKQKMVEMEVMRGAAGLKAAEFNLKQAFELAPLNKQKAEADLEGSLADTDYKRGQTKEFQETSGYREKLRNVKMDEALAGVEQTKAATRASTAAEASSRASTRHQDALATGVEAQNSYNDQLRPDRLVAEQAKLKGVATEQALKFSEQAGTLIQTAINAPDAATRDAILTGLETQKGSWIANAATAAKKLPYRGGAHKDELNQWNTGLGDEWEHLHKTLGEKTPVATQDMLGATKTTYEDQSSQKLKRIIQIEKAFNAYQKGVTKAWEAAAEDAPRATVGADGKPDYSVYDDGVVYKTPKGPMRWSAKKKLFEAI
jgi:hypothetical protein